MIFKLIIGIVVIYFLFKWIRRGSSMIGAKSGPQKIRTTESGEELVEDPQCHAYVPVSQAIGTEIDGKKSFFCSRKCLEQYRKRDR